MWWARHPPPLEITWKLGMNSKRHNKIRKLLRGRKEEGEAKIEVAGPPGRKHRHLLTPEVQRTGFHLPGGRREERPQTHASQDWNQKVGSSKATTPVKWRLGKSHPPSNKHRGIRLNDSPCHMVKKLVILRIWGHRPVLTQVGVSYLHTCMISKPHWEISTE